MKPINTVYSVLLIISLSLISILFTSCQNEPPESPIKGNLVIHSDESLVPLVNELKNEFMKLYKKSYLTVKYTKTKDGIVKIINDEAKIFISPRNFNKEEMEIIKKYNLEIRTFKFIYDGIAVIVNKESKIDSIKIEDLTALLMENSKKGRLVMPYKNSGIYDFIKEETLGGKDPLSPEFVEHEEDVIKIIKKDKTRYGLVGKNLVTDTLGVKIIPIGKISAVQLVEEYYDPHPAYLYQQVYPLTRSIYILLREQYVGLAGGFTTFLTSTDGQRIALQKFALAPAAVPVKLKQTY